MVLIGYFEGLDSQRGIDWRCADSLGLRTILGIAITEETPVHASMRDGCRTFEPFRHTHDPAALFNRRLHPGNLTFLVSQPGWFSIRQRN